MKFLKGFSKFMGAIIAFLLCIVYMGCLLTLTTIETTKVLLKEESIKNTIENIDFLSLSANDTLGENYSVDKTIKEVLEEELEKNGVDKQITNEIIASEELTSLISSFINKYVNYIIYDDAKPIITEQEINNVISIEKIENTLSIKLSTKEQEEINKFIKKTTKQLNEELPNKEDITKKEKNEKILLLINKLFSDEVRKILIISMFLIFLIIALCRFSLYRPFRALGVSNIIIWFILSCTYIIQKFGLKRLLSHQGAIDMIIIDIVEQIFKTFLLTGIITIASGIFMLLIYGIIKKIIYERRIRVEKGKKTIIDE